MRRPVPLMLAIALAASACSRASEPAATAKKFTIVEATIPDMRRAMEDGTVTSRELVVQSLARIATYEDRLNATIAVNPKAIEEAEALDRERAAGKIRGPLHGIPIALKDNIHTTNMPTTGGALAFEGLTPPYEATLTTRLKAAGAIIIAKTVLTELANWVAGGPTPMPANYSALASFGMNPYDPRRDPRDETNDGRPVLSTGGSSSGIGTAASFWAGNVGTETSGSILSPSNQNMLVGIKPTVGRVSRYGVIPITADQDTPGPMTRTVADAAIMLGAMEGTSPDPNDPATKTCTPPANNDYTPHLKRDGLKGARIGIPRAFFYDKVTPPGDKEERGGLNDAQRKAMTEAIEALKREGADHRRSGGAAERDGSGSEEQLPGVAHVFGRGWREGQRRRLLGRLQIRHEARLQRVARDARREGAAEDAERAARVQPRARARAWRSNTASRISTSRTKWTSRRIASATRPIARRTSPSPARAASTRRSRSTSSMRCSSPAAAAPRSPRSLAIRR